MVGIAGFEPALPEGNSALQAGAASRIRLMPKNQANCQRTLAESKRLERLCPLEERLFSKQAGRPTAHALRRELPIESG